MTVRTPHAALMLAVCFAFDAGSASAQIGRLRDKVQQKTAGTQTPKPSAAPAAGLTRVTATVEWTIESVMEDNGSCRHDANGKAERCTVGSIEFPPTPKAEKNGANTPGSLTDREQGRVTLELDVDPNNLPGGMVSRMTGGGLYSMGLSAGQPLNADRVASLAGSVTLTRQVRPFNRCHQVTQAEAGPGEMGEAGTWIDPVTLDATGREEFRAQDVNLIIGFRGDKPVSADFTHQPAFARGYSVMVAGKLTYGCGSTAALRDSTSQLGLVVKLSDQFPGMKTQVEKTSAGWVLTGRQEETQDAMPDKARNPAATRIVRVLKLTWTAPLAPAQAAGGAPAPNVADQMKFESGKGTVSFTQQGKSATWPLNSVSNNAMPGGGSSLVMLYTPDGGQPKEETGVFALSISNVMGQTMVGLNVSHGPAGDTSFEAENCTAKSTTTGGKTQGSGECREGGNVVKFTFTMSSK